MLSPNAIALAASVLVTVVPVHSFQFFLVFLVHWTYVYFETMLVSCLDSSLGHLFFYLVPFLLERSSF